MLERLRNLFQNPPEKLLALRQEDLHSTLEKLRERKEYLSSTTTPELIYMLSDASYLAGWFREWAEWKLEDRERYISAMALIEDILEEIDERW